MKPLSDVPEDLDEDSDAQSTTTVSDNHDGPVSPTDGDLYSYSEFDSLSQSSETSVRSGSEGGRRKTLQKMRLQNVHQELVYVTHIKHPCQFVIQRCADFRRLKAMSAAINKHCSNPVTRQHIPTELNPGDLVLAKYTLDENWYRGRVIGVVANDEESPSQQKAEVFYVDYGNTEMMPLNRLRMMHRNFLSTPELAVTCSLVDIVPASQNGEWDVEATLTFARMTEDKPMLMTVLREGEITFVDLSKPPSDEIEDDRPVSMRDALVFLELTRFSSPRSVLETPGGTKPKMLKRYLKPEMSRTGSSFRAMVSHVNSVYSFYIQKIGEEARYLVEMMMNLQQIYGADTGDLYTVFCPQKDMICAAQFSADNSWYRAEVTQLAGHRMVTVKYVDFGNEEQLSHWKLRKLRDPFLVLPKQAIHCRLADVEPVNKEQGWSVEALTSLRDFTPNPVMVRVTGVTADGQLLVVLHEAVHDDEEEDIKPSLNTLLVRQGYAHSTGPGSTFTQAAEHLDNHKDKTPARPAGRDKSNSREVNRTAMSSPYVQGEVNRTAPSHVSSSGELDMADDAQVKVLLSHVESPDKIFVQLADTSGLNSLMCDLDTAYQDSNLSDSASWKEKDYCAALYSGNKRWHRAQIMSIKDDIVEVIMLDYGYRDTLNLSFLRPLDEGFLTQSSFCLRCHLTDIQPAGDITRWSCTACEYLVELLSKGMCFIKPKGEVEDGSLATDLLLEERIMGDALSADRVEYNSVTKALLEKGLALPKRRAIAKKPPKPLPETDLPASPDVGSVLPHSANSSVASKIVMATTNGIAEEDASPRNSDDKHKLKEVIVTNEKVDTRVEFPPPDLPTGTDVTLVPTYVDYNCVVFGQEVKPAECTEGRFGFILQEHTLEVIAQDTYFARHCLRRARIPRDGNCLFRALASSAALGGDQTRHTSLRAAVVMTMRANWTEYCNVLGDVDREEYLSDMAKSATYGGEPEIHVLCQLYGVTVRVYLGGLNYRVQYRDYSIHSTQTDLIGAPALVEICYLADSAHYDLVVPEDMDMSYLDHLYNEWRVVRIEQLRHAPSISDISTYDDSLLQQLMERIQKHYADSSPDTDACWEVGQAIIARYMLDDQFYRAQITKINSDSTVEVHYVDFGNNETVPMERLRKDIILAEVPQQCLGLHLVGIKPCNPGKWPVKVLDYIHHLVVGQTCTVHIQEAPSVGDLVKVTMELSDGRDLATHMFDLGLAAPDEGMEPEVVVAPPTGIPKRTVTSPYGHLTPPEIGDLTLICVTQVSSPTEVYIQYVKQVRAVDPQFVAINRDLDSLLHIADELAQHAASYPSLTDIKPGVACCVQYSVDSCWYRAEVISMETTNGTLRYVGVLYVDYGNTEYVTPDSVKVLPDEFRHLTAQAIPCHLAGVVAPPRPDMPADSVIQALTELFASKILIAIAQSYGDDTLFINLYEHSAFMTFSHDAPLAYKELIDGGQLLSLRHDSDASAIIEEEIEEELDELESAFQLADCDIAERKRPLSWSEQAELEMPLDDASL